MYPFPGGKHICLHAESKEIRGKEKYWWLIHIEVKLRNQARIEVLPSIYCLAGRIHPIFRKKMNGSNPSQLGIEVLIRAPTYCLLAEKANE